MAVGWAEHLILIDSFLDVVVNTVGLWTFDVLFVRLVSEMNASFEMIHLDFLWAPFCVVWFCVDAARLVLFLFATVFVLFDSRFHPFILGTWGVYVVNLCCFCRDAESF